jgi:subtilisin family serine protease
MPLRWFRYWLLALGAAAAVVAQQAWAAPLPPTVKTIVDGDVTSYQWMLAATNAQEAWTKTQGAGALVATIDTGADATHPDLAGQLVPGGTVIKNHQGNPVIIPATLHQTSRDREGHGSHVAGIIVAADNGVGVTGIAPQAKLMPVDIDTTPLGAVKTLEAISAGVNFAVARGVDVINMSLGLPNVGLGGPERPYKKALKQLCDSVDGASAAGTVVVVAAGNSGDEGNPEETPASCSSAVTVAALEPSLQPTPWSSFDPQVDLSAPGEAILSVDSTAAQQSPTPDVMMSGTSMASPIVAGVAALLRSAHPRWSPHRIVHRMEHTAQDLGVPGRDANTGFGLVDAAAALGVHIAEATPSDFFVTWAYTGFTRHDVWVSWTTPPADPTTSYTVTVYHLDGTTTNYSVGGLGVRAPVAMVKDEGWTVTAHTTAGDVGTYPSIYGAHAPLGGGDRPDKLTDVTARRDADRVTVHLDRPPHPTSIDQIVTWVTVEHLPYRLRTLRRVHNFHHANAFPHSFSFDLPKWVRWYDITLDFQVTNTDHSGNVLGGRYQSLGVPARALYGSRVEGVLSAGPTNAEVTGGVSPTWAHQVCRNDSCVGQAVTLKVRQGSHWLSFPTRYDHDGNFHVLVPTQPHAHTVMVKVEGPKQLNSGPAHAIPIEG